MEFKLDRHIINRLLSPPIARAAYSDRTAWIMAELSMLAYEKFENDNCRSLKANLIQFDFEYVSHFNTNGTQAFLAKRDKDKIAVLSFRGTEIEFDDLKTDLNTMFYDEKGVKIHNGFFLAFDGVKQQVHQAISELTGFNLYITGHSLGGALALIATRSLNSDNIAACYTFGSPRVGCDEFGDSIKPPIYRVVNRADMVPRMPPVWSKELVVIVMKFVPVPFLRQFLVSLSSKAKGYAHHGDMRYLTRCKADFSDLRLVSNPSTFFLWFRLLTALVIDLKVGVTDHEISLYCNKLKQYAIHRLDQK